jgi:hypothetical protein
MYVVAPALHCCCCTARCLSALGRFKELAPRLLDRLLMAAVVAQPAAVLEGYAGAPTAFQNLKLTAFQVVFV